MYMTLRVYILVLPSLTQSKGIPLLKANNVMEKVRLECSQSSAVLRYCCSYNVLQVGLEMPWLSKVHGWARAPWCLAVVRSANWH